MNSEPNQDKAIIIGWPNIAKYFPFSQRTLQRKYSKIMLACGALIKARTGRGWRIYTTERKLARFERLVTNKQGQMIEAQNLNKLDLIGGMKNGEN